MDNSINMDLLSKDDIFKKILNVTNVQDFRRSVELSKAPEAKELLGFQGNRMIFDNDVVVNSIIKYENEKSIESEQSLNILQSSSSQMQQSQKLAKDCTEVSPKMCEMSSNTKKTTEKGVNKQKIILEPNGKKFLFLNGQKLQIIKHSPGLVQNKTDAAKELSKVISKISSCTNTVIKSISIQPKPSLQIRHIAPKPLTIPSKHPPNNLPKFSRKLISINKSHCPTKLSSIMKEVGGTIRLVNNVSSIQGIPPIKDKSSSGTVGSVKVATLLGRGVGKMENGQCNCKNNRNLVSVSTNTEEVKVVDTGVQTQQIHESKQVNEEYQSESSLSENFNSGVIIGDDVNMGHGPPGLYEINERKMKMRFLYDLQNCLRWDSGYLPIHKGVIEQDIQLVKTQCVILKIRKAGVNIRDNNNYTPLQLAILNSSNIEIVKLLLEYNADVSVLDSEGNNILHLAVEHNRNDLIKLFLENGRLNIDHYNYEGLTPLMLCALLGDRIDIAENLLKNGAGINLRDRKSGRSSIFHAAVCHNAPMVLLLLDYGADTKLRNFFGTSIHDAMFELDDIPNEIKYPILGRELKVTEKRKLQQQDSRKQENKRLDIFKRQKLEIVSTFQKLESKSKFVIRSKQK